MSNTFAVFNHISQAKIRCSTEEKCIGIFEKSRDSGPFLLCEKMFKISKGYVNSFFYKKNNYSGMYVLQNIFWNSPLCKMCLGLYTTNSFSISINYYYNYSQIVSGLLCIDISTISLHYGASWTYGTCSFAPKDENESKDTKKYVERCCLSEKEYTLTCRDSEKKGWREGYLEIQGHKHCHDFFNGYVARRKLTVSGRHLIFKI